VAHQGNRRLERGCLGVLRVETLDTPPFSRFSSTLPPAACALLTLALSALVLACAAATPAARWDKAERSKIEGAFARCEFFEDEEKHEAGYKCDLGTFRAHALQPGEDHAKASSRLAQEHARRSFTAPFEELRPKEPTPLGADTFDTSIASYRPEASSIIPPEVLLILTPQTGEKKLTFTCAIPLMPGLDSKEAIEGRMVSCVKGIQMLAEASR
jgi:hypothetical protein